MSTAGMEASPLIENNGPLFLTLALVIMGIYIDFLLPDAKDEEKSFLHRFIWWEIKVALIWPLIMLAGVWALAYFQDWPPSMTFTRVCLVSSVLLYYPSVHVVREAIAGEGSIRESTIRNAITIGYVVSIVSLFSCICALTGPDTINGLSTAIGDADAVYDFPYFPSQSSPPPPRLFVVQKDTENILVDFSQGYFTFALYTYASESVFFLVMFYLSHLFLVVELRFVCVLFDWIVISVINLFL